MYPVRRRMDYGVVNPRDGRERVALHRVGYRFFCELTNDVMAKRLGKGIPIASCMSRPAAATTAAKALLRIIIYKSNAVPSIPLPKKKERETRDQRSTRAPARDGSSESFSEHALNDYRYGRSDAP